MDNPEDAVKAVIMAGGKCSRWNNHGGVPKHLVDVDGEPLLYRTARLLKSRGIGDIIIVGPKNRDLRYEYPDTTLIPSKEHCCFEYELYDGNKLDENLVSPTGRTVIFPGDVYYTEFALDTLLYHDMKQGIIRLLADITYGRTRKEFVGFAFSRDFQPHLYWTMRCMDFTRVLPGWNSGAALFKALHKNTGYDLGKVNLYTSGLTSDFDIPEEYEAWKEYRETVFPETGDRP
jgi:hypothetical protein